MQRLLVSLSFVALCTAFVAVPVATGFSWSENLVFDNRGNLFVSDVTRGEIWKITLDEQRRYHQSLHISNFTRLLGLAVEQDGSIVYSTGVLDGIHVVIRFTADRPQTYQVIATIPKTGNGVALHFKTRKLYITTEGNFLPHAGEVYCVDLNNNYQVTTAMTKLFAADGAYIDQTTGMLYVSQVLGSTVLVYDIANEKQVRSFHADGITMLDDYTLSANGSTITGADFWTGNIATISTVDGKGFKLVGSGFKYPTSARFGGKGFNETSLFITEGGSIFKSTTDRCVYEILDVRQ
jgi:sugar lactone lactonase YvrE